ncbi:MarR family transcriptional regulator [Belnapia sp. T18]|uniref:MarR family transcriptional regulator n=1 Tax=Belnapia arida TaxID=2804533 RepID=A0ABS1U0U3_9PROT|nr:MarR family transcriptional regulator [Belnapia arida]MBL6077317.1 MarR family transcriptional regulator [Belnapia arida]
MSESTPTSPSLDLNEFLCFALHSTAQAMGRANKPMLEKIGLTYPQYLVMIVLWKEDNRTVSAIGDKLYLESSTLTPMLKRLEALGYIRRERDTEDERQVRIRLTEQGRTLHDKACELHPDWVEHVFGGDMQAVHDLKQRVIALRDKLLSVEG